MVASLREQLQGVSQYWSLTLEEKIIAVITHDRVINDNLKSKLKTKLCVLVDPTNLNFSTYWQLVIYIAR